MQIKRCGLLWGQSRYNYIKWTFDIGALLLLFLNNSQIVTFHTFCDNGRMQEVIINPIPFSFFCRCVVLEVYPFGLWDLWVAEHMSAPWCLGVKLWAGTLAGGQTDLLPPTWQVRGNL